jgi:hypothetical protein
MIFYLVILSTVFSNITFAQDIPYNQAIFKSSHNSYQRNSSLWDQLTLHQFHSLEFDLHRRKWLKKAPQGDLFVYHHLMDLKSEFTHFSEALDIIVNYQKQFSSHKVLTLFLDTDGFDQNHTIDDFNNLLLSKFNDKIFKPTDLKSNWPTLDELKGKIIFVLTKGDLQDYILSENQVAFVATSLRQPIKDAVFFNLPFKRLKESKNVTNPIMVKRVYFIKNEGQFKLAYDENINFLAIDNLEWQLGAE